MIDKFDGRFRFLSNFYPCEIEYQGITYPSNENYYVAMKINDMQLINGRMITINDAREYVATIKDPGVVKRFGRSIKVRKDWDDIKLKIMEYGVRQKFKNQELKEMLLSTGDQELVEGNYWHDIYWGKCICNKCGGGQNNLGKILMSVRDDIRNGPSSMRSPLATSD